MIEILTYRELWFFVFIVFMTGFTAGVFMVCLLLIEALKGKKVVDK